MERITITVPASLLAAVDASEKNRSRFFVRGARRELRARERAALRRSLDERVFTEEDRELEEAGLAEYAAALPPVDFDASLFEPIRWIAGKGWVRP